MISSETNLIQPKLVNCSAYQYNFKVEEKLITES